MRRGTRRALANLICFALALCVVLYLSLGRSHTTSGQTFSWRRIRYQTTAKKLPESYGICPEVWTSTKPALIVARVATDGDAQWVRSLADRYHPCIYTIDAAPMSTSIYLQVPANRGHEAMAYLTFIIDNYAVIPAAGAVFVHGSRFAWHNDDPHYDNAVLLSALNVSAAVQTQGYHNLRCDWSASTCSPDYGPSQGSLETRLGAKLEPWDARAASDAALSGAFRSLFGDGVDAGIESKVRLGRNDAVRAQCCAQFAVSQASILRHSRDEYVALRQWLLDDGVDAAPADDRVAGRILSYLWHILFIAPESQHNNDSVTDADTDNVDLDQLNMRACPSAGDCYCRLYGRCNLGGCTTPGVCHGQYTIPPDFRLPIGWAAAHS